MLLVNTYIGPSKIHGVGLFAGCDIAEGEKIWNYHPETCEIFTLKKFLKLCHDISFEQIKHYLDYSYIKNEKIYYISDNTRYINHSLVPNVGLLDCNTEVALRSIKKGEELLENYFDSYDSNDFFYISSLLNMNDKVNLIKTLETFYVAGSNIPCAI